MRWQRALAVLIALLAVLCESCARNDDEIRVGAFLSLSGSESTFGTDTQEGVDLAVEELNAAGGIRGKKVHVLYEDDKSTTLESSQKVRQLIDRDKVVAILGEVASSRSLAGGLIANTSKVPMISPSSTSPSVTEGRRWVFRTCFTDDQQGAAAARFVFRNMKKTRVAIFYAAQDTYSSGLATTFYDEFTRLGGQIVIDKGYPKGETNFRTYLSELRAANPEIVFVPNYYNEMVLIARQAKEAGIPGSAFLGTDGWDSPNLTDGAGVELEGAHFTNQYAPDMDGDNAKKFFAAFMRRYHHEPTSLTAMGYDSALVLFEAIRRSPDVTPDQIRDAIEGIKDFDVATGKISIDAGHNANKPVVVVEIKDKHFRYATQLTVESTSGVRHAQLHGARPASQPFRVVRIFEAIFAGITQGAMIALVALGYTMVYGVLKLINFAHSEVFMMGAYFGIVVLAMVTGDATSLNGMAIPQGALVRSASALGFLAGHPLVAAAVATVLAMAAAAGLGVGVERLAYRPLRGRGRGALTRVTPLVTAIGMSVLLQNLAQLIFSSRFRPYPQVVGGVVHVPAIGAISTSRILILVAAVVVMVALELIVKRTWFGKSMRALSANEEAARLMGVRTGRVIATTFALGSGLAALGAVLFCLDQSEVYPTMGFVIGTRAFVAAVLGGIGSITGAMLGGLLIGIIGELVKLTDYSGGVDVLVFVVLILVLLVKPAGLLGRAGVEKV